MIYKKDDMGRTPGAGRGKGLGQCCSSRQNWWTDWNSAVYRCPSDGGEGVQASWYVPYQYNTTYMAVG